MDIRRKYQQQDSLKKKLIEKQCEEVANVLSSTLCEMSEEIDLLIKLDNERKNRRKKHKIIIFELTNNEMISIVIQKNKKMTLSTKQKLAFQWFDKGLNFFITGSAGCGKSYILDAIASSDQIFKNIAVTASTGKAAHQIKGMTVHGFAGIEIGTKSVDYYYKHMQVDVLERWRNTHVLIIDEISMLNAETFDLLHHLACKINQCNDELFGGIQVITCGDFRQLPPVKGEYVLKSAIWKKYMFNVIELTESFRQENIEFFNALNEIRIGKVSDKTVDLLMTRHYEADHNINSNFIRLFFTNMEVDFYNLRQLMSISSDERWFHSKDVIKNLKINPLFQIPISINIKIGAVVMLVKNINVEESLCNGTIGIVTFIETDGVWVNINGREFKIENVREDILDCNS
ncbi:uncharacterized protein LOC136092709 [Hydra vulgaris]|uniref:uncharacterized protein LOC136092709 n=1 Tax=Hydra vulgaris TaxID=6087 RepID=UPI0032EA893E